MLFTPVAWILISGIFLVRMALFMSYPFLALHLQSLHFTSIDIGIILGCHYLVAGIVGVAGGNLADRWNPKSILILALLIASGSFLGLFFAKKFIFFLLLNSILAVSIASFEPIASVLITTNTPNELSALAFRYRYIAINAGAALGPMIGALITDSSTFLITSLLLFCYALLFSPLTLTKSVSSSSEIRLSDAIAHMAQNLPFLLLVMANLLVTMTYGQIFSTLPQMLAMHYASGKDLYSWMLILNPILVISTSLFLNRLLSSKGIKILFSIGSLLLSFSFLGFHFFPVGYIPYLFLMTLFTFGEIFLIPTTSKLLFDLAPTKFKGAYLGAESSSYLGFFFGNLIGGWLLQKEGDLFLYCSLSALIAFFFYRSACNLRDQKAFQNE